MAREDANAMNHTQLASIATFQPFRSIGPRVSESADGDPLALWELRRAGDDLLFATVFTGYGCALAIALSGQLIHFQVEPNVERLVRKAERLEARLLARGWTHVGTH